MRNLVLIFATLLCVYLYKNPRVETRETPAPVPRLVERPLPTAAPKVARTYYHSPLDAGAMSPSASTGTGYISTDPESRFRNGYYGGFNGYAGNGSYGSYGSAYGNYPYYGGGGGVVSNTVTYNVNTGGSTSSARPSLPHSYVGRPLPYPSNPSGGIAR